MPCPFCGGTLTRAKSKFVYTKDGKKRYRLLRCSKCRKLFLYETAENVENFK